MTWDADALARSSSTTCQVLGVDDTRLPCCRIWPRLPRLRGPTGLRELSADPGPDPIDRVATAVMSRQRSNGRLSTQSDRTQMREIT